MEIGILGATFNPLHLGHLLIAQQVLDFTSIKQVWFLPVYRHTFEKDIGSLKMRLEMLELALKNTNKMLLSRLEIDHKLDGNTINLLPILKQSFPNHTFTFIMGSDNLPTFTKWGSWEKLLEQLPFLVVPRAGFAAEPLYKNMQILKHPLLVINNISSTNIRERVRRGLPIKHLVTSEIEKYINTNCLYLDNT